MSVFDVKNALQQPNTAEAAIVVQERIRVLRERVESLRLEQPTQRRRSTPLRIGIALALATAAAALVATANGTGGSTRSSGRSAASSSLGLGRNQVRFESGTEASTAKTRPAHGHPHVVVHVRRHRAQRVQAHRAQHVRQDVAQAPAPVHVFRPAPTASVGIAPHTAVHAAAQVASRLGPASTPTGRRHTISPAVSVGKVDVHVVDEPVPTQSPTPAAAAPTTTEELPQP